MAHAVGRQDEEFAPEVPSRYLPPMGYKEMPEPLPLRKIMGPSVILLAAGIGSGEYLLWPYITSQVGLVFMWAAVLGVLTQVVINMEIERWTLATGETAVTGFTRLWKPWGILFVFMAMIPNLWPAWTTGGATLLTFAVGGGNPTIISIVALVAIGLTLTLSPVVYKVVETLVSIKVGLIVLFLLAAIVLATTGRAWTDLATGFSQVGQIPDGLSPALLLGALAFAGVGGAGNLVQSNWIRDKGFGMGQYIPRVVSPITGQEEAAPATGYLFPQDEANLARWRGWWKVANREQFLGFFLIGALSIIVLSVLSYSTVPVGTTEAEDLDFIRIEGEAIKDAVAPWFGTVFWLAGALTLMGGYLSILDYVSRLVADALKISYLGEHKFWSESKIYYAVLWFMIAFGSAILLLGFDQPLVLLVISASLAGIVMFVYSSLLLKLNRSALPAAIRLGGPRMGAMIFAVLLYGGASIVLVYSQLRTLFGG